MTLILQPFPALHVQNVMEAIQIHAQTITASECLLQVQMVKSYQINLAMALMSYANSKLSMERCLYTTHNLTILDQHILTCHNVLTT